MDRSLKARLIGASLIVLLVVLVAPELLSGRKAVTSETPDSPAAADAGKGQTRTYTIELGRTGAPAAADANVPRPYAPEAAPLAAERPARAQLPPPDRRDAAGSGAPVAVATRDAASSAAKPDPPAAQRSTGGPSVIQTTSVPAAATPPTASNAPARGTWSVQVGAFGSAESARRLVRQLEADGFSAYVSAIERNGKSLHRVRVGPEAARAAADSLASRLKARGLPVALVAND